MASTLKLAIAGCCGRMGTTLIKAALANKNVTLTAGSARAGFNVQAVHASLAAAGCPDLFVTSNPDELAGKADAVIDFTSPEATLAVAKAVAKRGGIHIIGTTGFSDSQQKEIASLASQARMVQSGNFSLGVNLLQTLVAQAAKILDDSYDIEIFEMHHKHKKDAPSGTALMLGNAAAKGRKTTLGSKETSERNGQRKRGEIGFVSARGGDVVGIHNVLFAGPGEVIELKHQGFSRDIYATGAIHAALWSENQRPGLYSMQDVLGLC
jgi:4-hydroxy-tetrahydrodipicolinate reductase